MKSGCGGRQQTADDDSLRFRRHKPGGSALAAPPTSDNIAALRIARNQALFRSVNDQVSRVSQHFSATPITFVCECADPDCIAQINLTHDEYDALRQDSTRFAVKPGHVFPEAEVVVEDHGHYVVVEKIGAAGRVAIATDRSDYPQGIRRV
jgi:hypothetical protein